MPRNKVYAIVEGQGEANRPMPSEQPAVATLTLRLLQSRKCRIASGREGLAS